MADIAGVNPLQKAFQDCLAGDNLCAEPEQAAVGLALDEAIRTDLAAIPQTLAPIFEDRKGTVAQPVRDLIRNKLTTAYATNPSSYVITLMRSANDGNGLTGDEFAIIYNDAGLHEQMNSGGAGMLNSFLSAAIALGATGTKIWIDDEVLAHLEKSLIEYGVGKELIAQYKALGISKPEIKATTDVKPAPTVKKKAPAKEKKAAGTVPAAKPPDVEKKEAAGPAPAGDLPQDL